ncbi:MAG: magnesium transporter [Erysipelotrichaceae bacterium]
MMTITVDRLKDWVSKHKVSLIREIFDEYNIVDLALLVDKLEINEILFLMKVLKRQYSGQLFTYLDNDVKEEVVNAFSSEEIKTVFDNLYSDDIVDFMEELPANLVKKILTSTSSTIRSQINELLSYPENSAGSLMSMDFVELYPNDSVGKAIGKIKKKGKLVETINYCFVIDEMRNLLGLVRLRDIIFAKNDEVIEDIMDKDIVSVLTTDDQEEVAKTMGKYDISVLPVVNDQDKLIGIITSDDIIDIIEEETTEDIQRMAAINPIEESYLNATVWEMSKSRIVWLLILMVSATLSGTIISGFEDRLTIIPLLSASIPLIMSTSGNAGSQSSIMVTRGITTDGLSMKDVMPVLWKELKVGIYCGICVFIADFVRIMILYRDVDFKINFVLSLTIFLDVVIAKLIGGILPLIAHYFKQDPAAMAAPVITTLVDAIALIVFFWLSVLILGI